MGQPSNYYEPPQQIYIEPEQETEIVKLFGAEIPVSALESTGFWAFTILAAIVILSVVYMKYGRKKE